MVIDILYQNGMIPLSLWGSEEFGFALLSFAVDS